MAQNNTNGSSCKTTCWLAALIAGVLVAALLMSMRHHGFLPAVFWGLVTLLVGGFVLNWAFCGKSEADVSSVPATDATTPSDATTAAAPVASTGAATTSAPVAENAAAAAVTAAPAAASAAPKVKPTAALAGEADVASRKGDWKYEPEAKAEAPAKKPAAKKPAAKKPAAKTAAKPTTDAAATAKAEPKAKPAAKPAAKAKPAPKAKAADTKPAAKAKAAPKAKAATAAKPAAKAKPMAADGKPELLTKARAGGADDLKLIKGVGPKMEGMLHTMGVFHFDQVASWRKKEVEWVDANLEGFKGRIIRDEWVKQAKVLMVGGQTVFSKKMTDAQKAKKGRV